MCTLIESKRYSAETPVDSTFILCDASHSDKESHPNAELLSCFSVRSRGFGGVENYDLTVLGQVLTRSLARNK